MLGLSPNGLIKLLCMQVLSFVLYGLGVGILIGGVLTQLISLIDTGRFLYDYVTLGLVSGGIIIVMLIVFGTQGYILSRQKLSKEMQHL
jgi:putative ABC transport system permease protein